MLLTQKLLSFFNRVFKKDPEQFLALRLSYDGGGMTWAIADGMLTTSVTGGAGQALNVDLAQYTFASLGTYLASQPGYSVLYMGDPDQLRLSARVLLDGSGDIAQSNGDHLYAYGSTLWAYLEAAAAVLEDAKRAIAEMVKQMSTTTASDVWLDELGGYYGIPRLPWEPDSAYGARIVAEVLRPRANNVALEEAIRVFTGQSAKVTDVIVWAATFPVHDGVVHYDSVRNYTSTTNYPRYGLFDVQYGYDLLNGGSFADFQTTVTDLIGRLRDAGTHLRSLLLTGGNIADTLDAPPDDGGDLALQVSVPLADSATAPTESYGLMPVTMSDLADTLTAPSDGITLNSAYTTKHDAKRAYSGAVPYASGLALIESI